MSKHQNVRTVYKLDSTRRAHLTSTIIFEWKLKVPCIREWNGWKVLYAGQPLVRQQGGSWQCSLSRYESESRREGEREREREREPLMTHEDGASFEKQEKYIMPKEKESIFGVLLVIFFFKWNASKRKCSGNQWMGLTLQLLAGTYTASRWLWFVCVFFSSSSVFLSSKWQYLSPYMFVFTFYSMSHFDRVLKFSCGNVVLQLYNSVLSAFTSWRQS